MTTLAEANLLDARLGIGRLGASRLGGFTPHLFVTIGGTDRSDIGIDPESVRIKLPTNTTSGSAGFTIRPPAGYIPTKSQTIEFGIGSARHLLFGGTIVDVDLELKPDHYDPFIHVRCTDWVRKFNHLLVTKTWVDMSITDILLDLVATYTSGFTTEWIATGLPTVDIYSAVNKRPMVIARELAELAGGGRVWIDPYLGFHFPGPSGASGIGTPPRELVDDLWSLKTFTDAGSDRQRATRVIVEGLSSELLLDYAGETYVPVRYGWMFGVGVDSVVRIGSNPPIPINRVIRYAGQVGPYFCQTTAPAVAGATTISVDDSGPIYDHAVVASPGTGTAMLTDDQGHIVQATVTTGAPTVITIPGSGFGSLLTDLPDGSYLRISDFLIVSSAIGLGYSAKAGEPVTVHEVKDDLAAQAALAATEGGDSDGVYEEIVTSSTASYVAARQIAQARLDAFSNGVHAADWVTEDLNAVPGVDQDIDLPGVVTATMPIAEVELTFQSLSELPLRRCKGGSTQQGGIVDAIADASS